MAFDFKKEYKEFYMPKARPEIVTVPKMNYIAVFFASPFWTKLQNIFGHCCMSKLDKVAKHWLALGRPAN